MAISVRRVGGYYYVYCGSRVVSRHLKESIANAKAEEIINSTRGSRVRRAGPRRQRKKISAYERAKFIYDNADV